MRHAQGLHAVAERDDGLGVVQNRFGKSFQFALDGIDGHGVGHLHLQPFSPGGRVEFHQIFGRRQAGVVLLEQADDLRLLVQKVEADVRIGLEQAHFPHLFERDAAGRQVGHAAVFEFQPGIGDVGRVAQHRNAARAHPAHGRLDDVQHQIEVVNHQIEDDRDLRAAWLEGRQPVRFDEHGPHDLAGQGQKRRIESLDVPDLHFEAGAFGQFQQAIGLGDGGRHGLFHENVLARTECFFGHFKVGGRGCHDVHRVHFGQQIGQFFETPDAELGFGGGGVRIVRVEKADQFPAIGGENTLQMDFAQVPGTEQANA